MRVDDVVVTVDRLSEEIFDTNPRHFDNRMLRLERGLYVIRERTSERDVKSEPSVAAFALSGEIYQS